jgi:CheY-like chemotaxis protein
MPDAIVLDLMEPDTNGLDLIRFVRKQKTPQPIPIIAVSGALAGFQMNQALSAGADMFLGKPVSVEVLLDTIAKAWNPQAAAELGDQVTGRLEKPTSALEDILSAPPPADQAKPAESGVKTDPLPAPPAAPDVKDAAPAASPTPSLSSPAPAAPPKPAIIPALAPAPVGQARPAAAPVPAPAAQAKPVEKAAPPASEAAKPMPVPHKPEPVVPKPEVLPRVKPLSPHT